MKNGNSSQDSQYYNSTIHRGEPSDRKAQNHQLPKAMGREIT